MARHAFSAAEANHAFDRLRAAVGFEQEVTLSPAEAYLILAAVDRLAYNSTRRR